MAPVVTADIDRFYKVHQQVAKKWEKCFKLLQEKEDGFISPYSTGYWKEYLKCWQGTGIDQDWQKLQRVIGEIEEDVR